MKRILSILCLAALLLQMTACSSNEPEETTAKTETVSSETTETETEEPEETAPQLKTNVPEAYDMSGREVPILQFAEATILSIDISEFTGDSLNDAIYQAHQNVMDRLKCTLTFIDNENIETTKIDNAYAAGEDAYDFVIGHQWKLAPLVTKQMLANLNPSGSSSESYIDLSKPWWYAGYIDETEIDNTHTYLLAGDASINVFRRASMLVCNIDLLQSTGGDIDSLYDEIIAGNWVWDNFAKMAEGIYVDSNGDGKRDSGDTYGYATWSRSDIDHMLIDSGIRACARDNDGLPSLAFNNEKTVSCIEKIYNLFWNNSGSYYEEGIPVDKMLGDNRLLFVLNKFSWLDTIREIDTTYTVIPMPKLDETIESYSSLVHDDAGLICVPVQSANLTDTTAVLEEMSFQYYYNVIPTYYNDILKTKYRRDGSDKASQIMDILHDSMATDFAYVYNYALGSMITNMRELIGVNKSSDFASFYAKNEKMYNISLKRLIESMREGE